MKITEKDISALRIVSMISGIFILIIALTMLFSLIQLKTIDPLDNPVLLDLQEQYNSNPDNADLAEQIRAIDLMARKAYFSSRRQIEIGSYLLLIGAAVFILCQMLISGQEKVLPSGPGEKKDPLANLRMGRRLLFISASVITFLALASSFILRDSLPDLRSEQHDRSGQGVFSGIFRSDKNGTSQEETDDYIISGEEFVVHESDFPFFRGVDGRGIAGGSGYPTEWDGDEGKNIKWKTIIPREGKSSPVIWKDRIFITGAEAKTCEVYCLDKNNGDIIWTASASDLPGEPEELPEMDPDAGLAVSTAAVNEYGVCAIYANGNLICLDHDGNRKWAKNLGTPENIYGYASSLIMYNNILAVQFDSNEKISLMGFDIGSGELIYETIRKGRPVWSSPVIGHFDGKAQIIINGNPDVTAFDPLTGEELWSVECMSGDVAPSVALNSSIVYAVTDYAKLAAIKPGENASIIWEDNMYTPDVASPVATNKYLFVPTGYGEIACYNAALGDTLWTHYFMESFYASPVIADNKVFFLDRTGMMRIVEAAGEFILVAEPTIGEPTDCTPAFSEKEIFIRGRDYLYCISEN
jgi:outer membrane protein assembly factor BamB